MEEKIFEIKKVAQEYGININERVLEKAFKQAFNWSKTSNDLAERKEDFFIALGMQEMKSEFCDFRVFAEKMCLGKKWGKVPSWFGHSLQIGYNQTRKIFYIKGYPGRRRVRIDGMEYVRNLAPQDVFFFEDQLHNKTNGVYSLKKIFGKEVALEILVKEICFFYEELEDDTLGNFKLKEMANKMGEIITDFHNESVKPEIL